MKVLEVLNERLVELMRDRGTRPAPLARNAELNESAVRDILRGRSKNPGIVTLHKIAAVLGVPTSELFEPADQLPVVGWIEDADKVQLPEKAGRPLYTVDSPFRTGVLPGVSALEVRTHAMNPCAREGDLILFELNPPGSEEAQAGRICVCELEDGSHAVGVFNLGDSPGRHRLLPVSPHAQPRLDVKIVAAHPFVMPLPAELLRRNARPTHAAPIGLHESGSRYDPMS